MSVLAPSAHDEVQQMIDDTLAKVDIPGVVDQAIIRALAAHGLVVVQPQAVVAPPVSAPAPAA